MIYEDHVEQVALEILRDLGYTVVCGSEIDPGEPGLREVHGMM